jgi:hypothetical protein
MKKGFISFEDANPTKGSVVLLYFEDIDSYFVDTTNDYNIDINTQYVISNDSGGCDISPSHWKYLKKDFYENNPHGYNVVMVN